ncbi:flagellar basal body-associated protein FliL [Gayadomonas joobiniege]|uniref:flagellar basal body-associated protein FliL n=1 Tax=Gayadomonas joobiniege TaxID=1234606 RepID=UPI0003787737|nr:flagellar basal body-associated protein FliL [Gayadomonas joobiniege]
MQASPKKTTVNLLISLLLLVWASKSIAQQDDFAYYGFEPDIITNYINNRNKPGYVRLSIELMVEKTDYLNLVEHHSPLLRDAIVEIIGQAPEEQIKSLSGRESLRKQCVDKIKSLLQKETGNPLIRDVLFTNYIYDS